MNDAVKNALVLDTAEKLDKEVSIYEHQAADVVIKSDADFSTAGDFAAEIKRMQKKVTDYWEPIRESTYKAYQDVLTHKKEMLKPLEKAEKILKNKMSAYYDEKERQRKELEEKQRKLVEEETERKLEEAVQANISGDLAAEEAALQEAEYMEMLARTSTVIQQAPSSKNISAKRAWEIVSIDESVVPVDVAGFVIRPVDAKAVMNLIKATKGQIKIPGVVFKETSTISIKTK